MTEKYVELTKEEFSEIYTNEEFRNIVAFASKCADTEMYACQYGSNNYKVTKGQRAQARKERKKAKNEIYAKHENDLLFIGAGQPHVPRYEGDPCNGRIGTVFANKEGHCYFIGIEEGNEGEKFVISGIVDLNRGLTLEQSYEICVYHNINNLMYKDLGLTYTKENILQLINEQFKCLFKEIIIDNFTLNSYDRDVICKSPKE